MSDPGPRKIDVSDSAQLVAVREQRNTLLAAALDEAAAWKGAFMDLESTTTATIAQLQAQISALSPPPEQKE